MSDRRSFLATIASIVLGRAIGFEAPLDWSKLKLVKTAGPIFVTDELVVATRQLARDLASGGFNVPAEYAAEILVKSLTSEVTALKRLGMMPLSPRKERSEAPESKYMADRPEALRRQRRRL